MNCEDKKNNESAPAKSGNGKTAIKLFAAFARIGLFTFGGGYAMLPMLERECVDAHPWATREELLDYYAIGQCAPGIIAANCAVFIGRRTAGLLGALAAVLGVITPSVVVITLLSLIWTKARELTLVQHAFNGIRIAVSALIVNAVIRLFRNNIIKNNPRLWLAVAICAVAFALTAFTELSPVWIVLGAAVAGLVLGRRSEA